jgi:hypothetical protein
LLLLAVAGRRYHNGRLERWTLLAVHRLQGFEWIWGRRFLLFQCQRKQKKA